MFTLWQLCQLSILLIPLFSNRGCHAFIGYFINICLWFHSILHYTEYVFGWGIAERQCLWINSANTEQHISYETPHCTKSFPIGERSFTCPIEAFISDNRSFISDNRSFIYKQWRQILMEAPFCTNDVITCNRGHISVCDVITLSEPHFASLNSHASLKILANYYFKVSWRIEI